MFRVYDKDTRAMSMTLKKKRKKKYSNKVKWKLILALFTRVVE